MNSPRSVDRQIEGAAVVDPLILERLRQARTASGEDVAAIARRIGVGERLILAIDEGRFADLPGGIYARTALRLYATALRQDAEEVLAACEPLLPSPEDPVEALARLQGLRPPRRRPPVESRAAQGLPSTPESRPFPPWRPLAAVALDGAAIAALLVVAVAAAIPVSGGAASSLGRAAAPVFAALGVLLGACYFVFFGGIACATAGERLVGMRVGRRSPRHVDPMHVGARALRCAGRDVRYLLRLGAWAGSAIRSTTSGDGADRTPSIGHAAGH
jgi:helix-turn-helix protein